MTTHNNTQKCPDAERLMHLISQTAKTFQITAGEAVDQEEADDLLREGIEVAQALEWLHTFLINRRGYQRKQQLKRKIMEGLLAEHGLTDELRVMTDKNLSDHLTKFINDGDNDD